MKIDFSVNKDYVFYETEIQKALEWLIKIRDGERQGWAWVQFISPNEQNTAEVIYTFSQNLEWLENNKKYIPILVESIEQWLLNTSHAEISIDYCWVLLALQSVRQCDILRNKINIINLEKAINDCLSWLCSNFYSSDTKGYGLGDNNKEISSVIRTALGIICLNNEMNYIKYSDKTSKNYEKYLKISKQAIGWLLSIQNPDGGWGNLSDRLVTQEYQKDHCFTYSDLKYQCDSNAASTGYVMLALSLDVNEYTIALRKAYNYLKNSQMNNGGWSVFTEIGVRKGERYTFRHFGTAWALQGIIKSGMADYTEECVIHGFEYLISLQDEVYGGWRSSPDADNYTWATCNALITINLLKKNLSLIQSQRFLSIIWDWWGLKKKDANYSFSFKGITFAFNNSMALLFCLAFTVMVTLFLILTFLIINPVFLNRQETLKKFVYSVIVVFDAVVLGLPWIIYVKNRFKNEVNGWIDSIGWVYGIITGFVLVLYQFIM